MESYLKEEKVRKEDIQDWLDLKVRSEERHNHNLLLKNQSFNGL
jgi:hypothetical protein